jgi:hypothetical protein
LRRETNDSLNDETFGSSESTSEDRAEEERKRRGNVSVSIGFIWNYGRASNSTLLLVQ